MDVEEILKRSEENVIIISYLTEWSGASHIQKIYLNNLDEEYKGQIETLAFEKSETGESQLDYFSVSTFPTSIAIKDRHIIGFWEGLTSKNKIRKVIDPNLDRG